MENEIRHIPAILKDIPATQIADMRRQVHKTGMAISLGEAWVFLRILADVCQPDFQTLTSFLAKIHLFKSKINSSPLSAKVAKIQAEHAPFQSKPAKFKLFPLGWHMKMLIVVVNHWLSSFSPILISP